VLGKSQVVVAPGITMAARQPLHGDQYSSHPKGGRQGPGGLGHMAGGGACAHLISIFMDALVFSSNMDVCTCCFMSVFVWCNGAYLSFFYEKSRLLLHYRGEKSPDIQITAHTPT
jgi:hypothetical protein